MPQLNRHEKQSREAERCVSSARNKWSMELKTESVLPSIEVGICIVVMMLVSQRIWDENKCFFVKTPQQ